MYYPKSKIIPDQYTNGDKLIYASSRLNYLGYYHILADGRIFSGKNPNDGIPQLLVFPIDVSSRPQTIEELPFPTNEPENYIFNTTGTDYDAIRLKSNIQPPSISLIEPKYTPPIATYPSFIRYFVKRTNNSVYIEVNKSTYNAIESKDSKWNWAIYFAFNIPWTTGGNFKNEVYKVNRDIVLLTEQRLKLYGFSNYITDYTEFYI